VVLNLLTIDIVLQVYLLRGKIS